MSVRCTEAPAIAPSPTARATFPAARAVSPACGTAGAGSCLGYALDFDDTAAVQMVQVPPDCCGREAQHVAELGGADGAMLQNGTQHAVPGTLVRVRHRRNGDVAALRAGAGRSVPGKRHSSSVGHGIHNTIVS